MQQDSGLNSQQLKVTSIVAFLCARLNVSRWCNWQCGSPICRVPNKKFGLTLLATATLHKNCLHATQANWPRPSYVVWEQWQAWKLFEKAKLAAIFLLAIENCREFGSMGLFDTRNNLLEILSYLAKSPLQRIVRKLAGCTKTSIVSIVCLIKKLWPSWRSLLTLKHEHDWYLDNVNWTYPPSSTWSSGFLTYTSQLCSILGTQSVALNGNNK